MSPERKVTLKGWDHDEKFEVDEDVAQESQLLKDLMEAVGVESPIPLPNVSREILKKVIEFCKYHVEAVKKSEDNRPAAVDDEIKSWNKEFMKVDQVTVYHLMNAANYLNIKKLLDLSCQTLANMIKDKSPEEMMKIFNIKNDFSPEEKEALKRDYQWAFE